MSGINMLFYSNKCEGSKLLLSMLNSEKLTKFFHIVCTDNNPKVPPQIKLTPTLIIRGQPTPYVAGDAFIWLARVKQWKIIMTMKKMNTMQQQYFKNINNNLSADDSNILGFSAAEMNGMSDIFSFFSRDIVQENQESFPQSYFSCANLGHENIFTPPLEDGSFKIKGEAKYKIDSIKQRELCKKLEQERQCQDVNIKKTIDSFMDQNTK